MSVQNISAESSFDRIPSIQKSDITFVVSGKIKLTGEFSTPRCLASIRRFFPSSQIILSTWEGEPTDGLDKLYDKLLLLQEPDEIPVNYSLKTTRDRRRNSINLQQLGVHTGMEQVSTEYAVRLRTDFYLTNDNFLKFYGAWTRILSKTDAEFCAFKERVLVLRYLIPDARLNGGAYAYYLSDCFQFGRTDDLLKLWDGHQESYETFNYFEDHPDSPWENPNQFNSQYSAEQYFFLNLLRKEQINIAFPAYYFDHSTDQFISESEKIYAANFLIGNHQQLGLQSRFYNRDINHLSYLTLERLIEMYLYTIEPGNTACARYLKKQSFKAAFCKRCSTWLRRLKGGMKAVLRIFLPAYRVSVRLEAAQQFRFDLLVSKLNELSYEQEHLKEEICKLKNHLSHDTESELGD